LSCHTKFQSARPRGARHQWVTAIAGDTWFQSARPRGARPYFDQWCVDVQEFQSARPRGARPSRWGRSSRRRWVSIRAPAWGATGNTGGRRTRWTCFNPRARVGRDCRSFVSPQCVVLVSIRAPAWGATLFHAAVAHGHVVSIRAPAWGATVDVADDLARHHVSIRAPAWGATPRSCRRQCPRSGFNPRARVGRDSPSAARHCELTSFNPRARVGRDRLGAGF